MRVVDITYFQLLGKPIIFYLGILTYLSFLSTSVVGFFVYKTGRVPIKYHKVLAITSLILATIHGLLGVLSYI